MAGVDGVKLGTGMLESAIAADFSRNLHVDPNAVRVVSVTSNGAVVEVNNGQKVGPALSEAVRSGGYAMTSARDALEQHVGGNPSRFHLEDAVVHGGEVASKRTTPTPLMAWAPKYVPRVTPGVPIVATKRSHHVADTVRSVQGHHGPYGYGPPSPLMHSIEDVVAAMQARERERK